MHEVLSSHLAGDREILVCWNMCHKRLVMSFPTQVLVSIQHKRVSFTYYWCVGNTSVLRASFVLVEYNQQFQTYITICRIYKQICQYARIITALPQEGMLSYAFMF